jgi:Ca-activated chloride channel family protein
MLYGYFDDINFAYPQLFLLGLLLPFMVFWYFKKENQQAAIKVSSSKNFAGLSSWKNIVMHIPFVLRLLAVAFIIVALARPQTKNEIQNVNGEGIDIVLCIDISGSMTAQDFTPNRMEAAKKVAEDFVDKRVADRIGVVIFAGESFTVCPLTTDHTVLKNSIAGIQNGLLEDGTSIGDGLATGVDRLRSGTSKSKVIILLTDGENNGGLIDPSTAKEIARTFGVKVYTIGVGTEGYASFPIQTELGVIMQKEKVEIDEKLLTEIANETGGHYYRATDNTSLESIYRQIDGLEKSKVEITTTTTYTEKFFPFVMIALGLVFMELLLRYMVIRKFP